jgi:hypothetical protein
VFKSTDGGQHWKAFNSGLTNTLVQSLALDPTTPTTLYVGTWGSGVFAMRDLPYPSYLPVIQRGP